MPTALPLLTPNSQAVFGPFTFKFGSDLVLYVQWAGLNSFLAIRALPALTPNVLVTAEDIATAKTMRENPSILPPDWLS